MPSDRVSAARRAAILTRHRPADDPELIDAKRDHAVLAIEDFVSRVVASAPPLRPEQIERLRGLIPAVTADVAA
jgi:hypothetical protein